MENTCAPADDPVGLLDSLRGRVDSPRFRLFAVGCCRRIWGHLPSELRGAVEIAESVAHGATDDVRRRTEFDAVRARCIYVDGDSTPADRLHSFAAEAALNCLFGDDDYPPISTYAATCAIAAAAAVVEVVGAAAELTGESDEECELRVADERRWQCETIRRQLGL